MAGIPTYLISGLLGSGKTTCLRQLIKQKPENENWAVLINEFGEVDIDGATLSQNNAVTIKAVSGGCICCSAQFNLAQALGELSRQPIDKLFIEPTGLGHPAKVLDTLKQFPQFTLHKTLCVITPQQLTEVRWQKSQVMRDLVTLADLIVLNKTDLSSQQEVTKSQAILKRLYTQKTILPTQFAQITIEQLKPPEQARPLFQFQAVATDFSLKQNADAVHASENRDWNSTLPGVEQAFLQIDPQNGRLLAIGWQFSAEVQFNRIALKAWIDNFAPLMARAKGLVRTGKEWQLLNYIDNHLQLEDIAWRQDSRLECLFTEAPNSIPPHKDTIISMESQLLSAIQLR
ncbi:CobW family GTP-binding protein [Thiomicrorhabdus xiamenensis]|uniref:GTP-binding protein n=1 Tax=Thiomicrorhabdus xiamenensis TaxID=2739063 RepID=A0A7D4T1Z8_9GAMM|nr:GTP-binding protein [Thiomicrorhabdus xiamenensis]QKI89965.1 GTP-binding protein [Thiomicrorhabdus xiamenensis]